MRLRDTGLAVREIDGEMVVLDLASSTYLTTNRTGATIMALLSHEQSPEQLVDALVETYGVSHATARTDVEAFVRVLQDKGLLAADTRLDASPGGAGDASPTR
jgi:hypothetical protein